MMLEEQVSSSFSVCFSLIPLIFFLVSSFSLVHNSSPLLSLAMQSAGHRLGLKPHKAGSLFFFSFFSLAVSMFSSYLFLSLSLSLSLSLCVCVCVVGIGARDCEDRKVLFGPCDIEGHGMCSPFPVSCVQTDRLSASLLVFVVGLDGRLYILDFARVQVLPLLSSSLAQSLTQLNHHSLQPHPTRLSRTAISISTFGLSLSVSLTLFLSLSLTHKQTNSPEWLLGSGKARTEIEGEERTEEEEEEMRGRRELSSGAFVVLCICVFTLFFCFSRCLLSIWC